MRWVVAHYIDIGEVKLTAFRFLFAQKWRFFLRHDDPDRITFGGTYGSELGSNFGPSVTDALQE